jgi:hypothetical protein
MNILIDDEGIAALRSTGSKTRNGTVRHYYMHMETSTLVISKGVPVTEMVDKVCAASIGADRSTPKVKAKVTLHEVVQVDEYERTLTEVFAGTG